MDGNEGPPAAPKKGPGGEARPSTLETPTGDRGADLGHATGQDQHVRQQSRHHDEHARNKDTGKELEHAKQHCEHTRQNEKT